MEWVDNHYPNGISVELELCREPALKGFLAGVALNKVTDSTVRFILHRDVVPRLVTGELKTTHEVMIAAGLAIRDYCYANNQKRKNCDVCGAEMTLIRGRYPKTDKRWVCPTCLAERMDNIAELSDKNYGRAYKNFGR